MYKNVAQQTQQTQPSSPTILPVPKPKVNLAKILEAGYANKDKQESFAISHGYIRDPSSNDNTQIYFHPPSKSLLVNVSGTHNIKDVGTDVALMAGKLQDTQRFKDYKKTVSDAKAKYNPSQTTQVGHSLGASIIMQGSGGDDKVHALDPGFVLGQKVRKGQNIYRSSGDIVSILGAGNKNVKTIQGKQSLFSPGGSILQRVKNAIDAHKVSNIKNKNIFV